MGNPATLPDDYPELLDRLKREIAGARVRTAPAVNDELIRLYWRIGKEILERQQKEGWGAKVIDRLSADLRQEFSGMRGLSVRNLKYMRSFAAAWDSTEIVQRPVAQLPWGHVCCLLDKLGDLEERLWYAQRSVDEGWSRKLLEHHIATRRYVRDER